MKAAIKSDARNQQYRERGRVIKQTRSLALAVLFAFPSLSAVL